MTQDEMIKQQEELRKQYEEQLQKPSFFSSPQKIVGYLLLSPAIVSVLLFFITLFLEDNSETLFSKFSNTIWTGDYGYSDGGGGGYTSALPFYFGLMALAGAYLIKDSSPKD